MIYIPLIASIVFICICCYYWNQNIQKAVEGGNKKYERKANYFRISSYIFSFITAFIISRIFYEAYKNFKFVITKGFDLAAFFSIISFITGLLLKESLLSVFQYKDFKPVRIFLILLFFLASIFIVQSLIDLYWQATESSSKP